MGPLAANEMVALVLAQRVGSGGPMTTQGKWMALSLAHQSGAQAYRKIPSRPLLYKQLGISARHGPKAYGDLVACKWIRDGHFSPRLSHEPEQLTHSGTIRLVLDYPSPFVDLLQLRYGLELTANNRLMLVTLLGLASVEGVIHAISDGALMKLTGFKPAQLKCQMQRLKQLGFVSGVVPGVSCQRDYGVAESCVYLNLLHPCWSHFYADWTIIQLSPAIWDLIGAVERGSFRRIIGRLPDRAMLEEPEKAGYFRSVQRYLRNLILVGVSRILSTSFADRTANGYPAGIKHMNWIALDLFPVVRAVLASLQESHGVTDRELNSAPCSFCLLPPFGVSALEIKEEVGPMLLTNHEEIEAGLDARWFSGHRHETWVAKGIVTAASEAPSKYRSGQRSASELLDALFRDINT